MSMLNEDYIGTFVIIEAKLSPDGKAGSSYRNGEYFVLNQSPTSIYAIKLDTYSAAAASKTECFPLAEFTVYSDGYDEDRLEELIDRVAKLATPPKDRPLQWAEHVYMNCALMADKLATYVRQEPTPFVVAESKLTEGILLQMLSEQQRTNRLLAQLIARPANGPGAAPTEAVAKADWHNTTNPARYEGILEITAKGFGKTHFEKVLKEAGYRIDYSETNMNNSTVTLRARWRS